MFVAQKTAPRGSTKELDALTAIVVAHHLGNPKVKDFIPAFASAGPAGQKFLVTVSEKATDKSVKGLAYFHLGMALAKQLQQEEDGKKIDELMARATDYFQKAAKEAPDAVVGVTTVGKAAADELAALEAAPSSSPSASLPPTLKAPTSPAKRSSSRATRERWSCSISGPLGAARAAP